MGRANIPPGPFSWRITVDYEMMYPDDLAATSTTDTGSDMGWLSDVWSVGTEAIRRGISVGADYVGANLRNQQQQRQLQQQQQLLAQQSGASSSMNPTVLIAAAAGVLLVVVLIARR